MKRLLVSKYVLIIVVLLFIVSQFLVLTTADAINSNLKSDSIVYNFRNSANNENILSYNLKINATRTTEIEICEKITKTYLEKFSSVIPTLKNVIIHTDSELRRGLSNKNVIYMRCLPDHDEYLNVLIHEIGHVVDLGYLIEVSTKQSEKTEFDDFGESVYVSDPSYSFYSISWKNNSTLNERVKPMDFVSLYGSTDPFEDFAESFMMYVRYNAIFKELTIDNYVLAKKYAYFENLFEFNNLENLVDQSVSLATIDNPLFVMNALRQNSVYDATRIHYNLREYL